MNFRLLPLFCDGEMRHMARSGLPFIRHFFVAILLSLSAFGEDATAEGPASFVNPFIGTGKHGHSYPGAVAPFGIVQMTPLFEKNGYYYTDKQMHGFVVNSLSGAGIKNQGAVLLTATTGPVKTGFAETDYQFDHRNESASAGYYQVLMKPWNINAEMTATPHCGLVRFTFPAGKQANIISPLSHTNTKQTHGAHVKFIDSRTVVGDVTFQQIAGRKDGITVHFVMSFSEPFDCYGTWTNGVLTKGSASAAQDDAKTSIGLFGSYKPQDSPRVVTARIGISYVDLDGAFANLREEIPEDDFDKVRKEAFAQWNDALSVIETEGGDENHNRIFYTALYHCMLAPAVFSDVDGRYRGFDDRIHKVTDGHKHFYANFSGWDIYRSQIPLLALIEPERAQDMAQSVVESYRQLGYIDRWTEMNRATAIMNGNPMTLVLTHIWNAGLHGFDIDTAYQAMLKQARHGDAPVKLGVYQKYAEEMGGVTIAPQSSPSTALEYHASFGALHNLAKNLNKTDDAEFLRGRSLEYRDWYNPVSGFFQRKDDNGNWDYAFNGTKQGSHVGHYTEGNQWIYRWFVPHDVAGLVDLMGGPAVFESRLDQFFAEKRFDPTNEPDMHAPFLYNYVNRPWKTQRHVAETADESYTDTPEGLAGGGNDDLGTMSAWYVFSQLGFFPANVGIPDYGVCTPRFKRITIHLKPPYPGKQFVINTPKASPENKYIRSSILNGKPLARTWFSSREVTSGGTWDVDVDSRPNRDFDSAPYEAPYSVSAGYSRAANNFFVQEIDSSSDEAASTWRFTTARPADNWAARAFDDSAWKEGLGPFGSGSAAGQPRTSWTTRDIWMRRNFDLPDNIHQPAILACYEPGIEVYVNGILVADTPRQAGWTGWWPYYKPTTWSREVTLLPSEVLKSLRPKGNLLAVHAAQKEKAPHHVDVSIIDIRPSKNQQP